jgi:endonuclease/exonuclease/phosphatase (EEP) superfamily protein YafD
MVAIAWLTDVQWVVVGLLALVAATAVLRVSLHVGLAVAQDALPYLLLIAWIVLVMALFEGAWVLAAVSALLVVYHLALVVPRLLRIRAPRWVAAAPTFRLVVSNVFTENETPDELARTVLAADGDVMIITEWNPTFAAAFDAAGATASHPHRLVDEADTSEYNVCVASKVPLDDDSRIVEIDQLKLTQAVVPFAGRKVQVIGIIPNAVVDPGGFDIWKQQIATLVRQVPSLDRPVLIAGDFNTTRFRPEFRALLRAGLYDAHDALGRSLKPSFRLATDGVLSSPGVVIRLDHALLSKDIFAVEAHDLDSSGSDHLPFAMTLAVRPNRRGAATVSKVGGRRALRAVQSSRAADRRATRIVKQGATTVSGRSDRPIPPT